MKNNISDIGRQKIREAHERGRAKQREQHQQRIAQYNENPKRCKLCNNPICYEKRQNDYCNHSCAATFCNKKWFHEDGRSKKVKHPNCLDCGSDIRSLIGYKFCNRTCQARHEWKVLKQKILDSHEIPCEYERHKHILRKFLFETRGKKCEICGLTEWRGKEIPLVVDHIDGHSNNNRLDNLRVLCCNCDAQTPTYKSKNRGKGRAYRRQRYAEGKSW